MSIVKGIQGDINPAFLSKLENAFPERQAMWRPGDDLPEVARKAGCREVIEWIKRHAVQAASS